jgi:carboxyl-terminal processing protease
VSKIKFNKRNLAIGASTVFLATIAVAGASSQLSQGVALLKDNPKELVEEVWQIVNFSYVDGTFNKKDWNALRRKYVVNANYNTKEQAYTGARNLLKNLGDPYTRFMNPKEFADLKTDTSGVLVGVGLQLTQDDKTKKLVVVAPIEDTPASKAGILPKDIIIKIDGKSTRGMDVNKAVQLIRGAEGTTVILTVNRGGKIIENTLKRQKIDIHSVKAEYRPDELGGVGYIRLSQFSANAADEMKAAIQKMEAKNVRGYVLDLRSNPGGLLYAAVEIGRMWLNEGTIVSTRNRSGGCDGRSTDCKQNADGTALTDKPLVVLLNGGSASASEILAGALQDNRRATLVGETTFGKGLVQAVRSLKDGSGMAVTIAKYYTPNGKNIHKVGIAPDVKIVLSKKDIEAIIKDRKRLGTTKDPQYAKALSVLGERIASGSATPTTAPSASSSASPSVSVNVPVPTPSASSSTLPSSPTLPSTPAVPSVMPTGTIPPRAVPAAP